MAFQLENMDLILLRLPVKSLARFKCVSKTWLFLISSYKFAKEQLKISTKNNVYLHDRFVFGSGKLPMDLYTCSIQSLVHGTQIYPPTDENNLLFDRARVDNKNPLSREDGEIEIVGSCNGLVCLALDLVLWNPTTGKLKRLPDSGTISNIFVYGFGYDEVHDDYKVVECSHALDENKEYVSGGRVVKVYSVRNNSWKTLSNWPGGGHIFGCEMGKFLNGNIHWLVREFSDDVNWAIVSHDLATDTFTVWRLPFVVDIYYAALVNILEGRLALFFFCKSHVDLWVMKEYGVHKSWTLSIRIPHLSESSFRKAGFTGSIRPHPVFYWAEHDKVLFDYRTNLAMYDLNNPQPHQFGREFLVEYTTYFESLVSPHLDDEVVLVRKMPLEIITKILTRLPVESLLRFKSVSKEWRSLISSSSFVEAHLKTSVTKNDVVLIFGPTTNNNQELYTCSIDSILARALNGTVYSVDDEDPHFEYSFSFLESSVVDTPEAAEIRFVGSCNGLICQSLSRKIILTNPVTDQEKILPNSSRTNDERYNLSYSFGFDQVHGDYKVVELDHDEPTLVQVYSMRTNSWEALLTWPGGDTCGNLGKFLNGSIHWLVRDMLDGLIIINRWFIVSLDLATLTFSRSPLPPNILVDIDDDDDAALVEVAIVGGCLAVCCTHRADMDVWVMKEYGVSESWTRVVRMDLGNYHAGGFARPRPLFFLGDGKILMNYGSSLKIYDSANPQPHVFDIDLRLDAIAFVETLVPVTLEGEDVVDCC